MFENQSFFKAPKWRFLFLIRGAAADVIQGHKRVNATPLMYFPPNSSFPNYVSVSANNNLKSRLRAKFSYICCIFSHEALTSGYCSRERKRYSEVSYWLDYLLSRKNALIIMYACISLVRRVYLSCTRASVSCKRVSLSCTRASVSCKSVSLSCTRASVSCKRVRVHLCRVSVYLRHVRVHLCHVRVHLCRARVYLRHVRVYSHLCRVHVFLCHVHVHLCLVRMYWCRVCVSVPCARIFVSCACVSVWVCAIKESVRTYSVRRACVYLGVWSCLTKESWVCRVGGVYLCRVFF